MIRTALKTAFAHKLRLLLTAAAVMFGVAFIAGTYIFTDTIDKTFSQMFDDIYEGQDVIVQSVSEFDVGFSGPAPMDESVLDTVLAVPGVEAAEGSVGGFAIIYDKEGDAIVPAGPPTIGGSMTDDLRLAGNVGLRDGRVPTAPNEVAIDARTADDHDLAVGDVVKVQTPDQVAEYEIVATLRFGDSDNLSGATWAGFEMRTAQELFGLKGQYSAITVIGEDGTNVDVLRNSIAAALPSGVEAVSAADEAAAQSEALSESLGFIRTALLVFGLVAVFVASFIIQNTFRIIVRQRQKELALLRAVGATGTQVIWMVVLEAVLVAVVASVLGILVGYGLAQALTALMAAAGFDLPATSAPLAARTIIISLVVGVFVTVAAAVLPAIRASKIPPVAALQDVDVSLRMSDRKRAIIGGALAVVAIGMIVAGLFGDVLDLGPLNELSAVGMGALILFLAVALLSSNVVKPSAKVLGRRPVLAVLAALAGLILAVGGLGLVVVGPTLGAMAVVLVPFGLVVLALGVFGLYLAASAFSDPFSPALATQNSIRKPRRTATTAAALMIGLALVGFFFVLGDSIKASASSAIEEGLRADYVLSVNGFSGGFSPQLGEELAGSPEIGAVTPLRFGFWDNEGTEDFVMGIDTETAAETIELGITAGSLEALGDGGVFVLEDIADDKGWVVGDTVPMGFATTGLQQMEIVGIYTEANVVNSNFLMGLQTYEQNFEGFGTDVDFVLAVKAADGVAPADSRSVIEAAAVDYPNVQVRDQTEYRESQESQVDQILVIFNGLLGLAVFIAVIGITNTLALSVFERTREVGLLRAVGLQRRQVVRTVSWESVIVAVIGAVLGIVLGLFFGVIVTAALSSQGIDVLSIPLLQISSLVVFGVIAGLVAAILPARRASRLNILEAIAYE